MEENNYPTNEGAKEVPQHPEKLIISPEIEVSLFEIVSWGRFLSIMGFIGAGLMILCGVVMTFFGTAFSAITSGIPFVGGFIGVIYALLGLVYYFPAKYLNGFSTFAKQALLLKDQESLNYAFTRLKSHYKFIGIMVIVMLCLYVLIFLFAIGAGILASGMGN